MTTSQPSRSIGWPHKFDLFGVQVSATSYEDAATSIIEVAARGRSAIVSNLAVHGVVLAHGDLAFRSKINSFEIVAPDGQPVRLALNLLYGLNLSDRVYGPELMLRLCEKAAAVGIGVYFYGSYPNVVENLRKNLIQRIPALGVVGYEPSAFRPLTLEEDRALIDRINQSGAGLVFLGLGCPLQENFAFEHRPFLNAVQLCVGAAFDFHAGNKKMAP